MTFHSGIPFLSHNRQSMNILRIEFEHHPTGLDQTQVGYSDNFVAFLDDEFPTGRATFRGIVEVTPNGYRAKTSSMGSWGAVRGTAADAIKAILDRVVDEYRRVLADPAYRSRAESDPEVAATIQRASTSAFWNYKQEAVTLTSMADLLEELTAWGDTAGMPRALVSKARGMISSARSTKTV